LYKGKYSNTAGLLIENVTTVTHSLLHENHGSKDGYNGLPVYPASLEFLLKGCCPKD
jgi:hypothetical protein